jgi:hypothetical protein
VRPSHDRLSTVQALINGFLVSTLYAKGTRHRDSLTEASYYMGVRLPVAIASPTLAAAAWSCHIRLQHCMKLCLAICHVCAVVIAAGPPEFMPVSTEGFQIRCRLCTSRSSP